MNYKKFFEIPEDSKISEEAKDLLRRLIADPDERLGTNGVEEIKNHPFFRGVDWENLRKVKAPLIPKLKGKTDTSNFENFEEETSWFEEFKNNKNYKRRRDYYWIGYTFKKPRDFANAQDLKEIFQ